MRFLHLSRYFKNKYNMLPEEAIMNFFKGKEIH